MAAARKNSKEFKLTFALRSSSWFHQNLTSKSAGELLEKRGRVGSFLVHPSATTPGSYTLSVKREHDTTHVRIQNNGDTFDLYGGEHFATLTELVQHYVEGSEVLKEKSGATIPLIYPISDEVPHQRWYHGTITGKESEQILQREGEPGSYLVRQSLSKPGEFVLSVLTDEPLTQDSVTVYKVTHILIRHEKDQYVVGDGHSFKSLSDLLEHCRRLPVIQTGGQDVRLSQPLNASRTTVTTLAARIQILEQFDGQKHGFLEEFEKLNQLDGENTNTRLDGQNPENKPKNRFKNILPYDQTRVKLKDGDPSAPGSDYINANYVKISMDKVKDRTLKSYIATQGCLNNTIADFWRMIFQEKCQIIVMTTKLIEAGKNKCAKYWPDEFTPEFELEIFTGKLIVRYVKEAEHPSYTMREMTLVHMLKNGKVSKPRHIYQYHYTSWPDKQVPSDPSQILDFIRAYDVKYRELPKKRPVVVHCSAGIGRTGTTMAIDVMLDLIDEFGSECELDVLRTVNTLREQRSGLVQTDAQYRFIYSALQLYLENPRKPLTPNNKPTKKSSKPQPVETEVYENVEQLPSKKRS